MAKAQNLRENFPTKLMKMKEVTPCSKENNKETIGKCNEIVACNKIILMQSKAVIKLDSDVEVQWVKQ